jgi:hypothetical protein
MASTSELERRLREWGYAYGQRPEGPEPAEPEAETALHKSSVDRSREAQAVTRLPSSFTRTTVQLRRLRAKLGGFVPAWAGGDTVRCTETRSGGGGWHPPAAATQVEDAVLALGRHDRRAALALRASYCLLGRRPLSERIAWATACGAAGLSRMGYRAALARGRIAVAATLKIAG